MTRLVLEDVNAYRETSHILHNVSLEVADGEIVTIVGRNGAGKTTTLESIMGLVDVQGGAITFDGEEITNEPPYEISDRGLSLVPQGRGLFPYMTVQENLRMGHLGHDVTNVDDLYDTVFEHLPKLQERLDQQAGSLSGGEQQMLSIGRGLMSQPDLLLVDEPTEGLMPSLVTRIGQLLDELNVNGLTVLLVEQDVNLALDISDRGYIIDEGIIQKEGTAKELREDKEIRDRYLTI